MLWLFALLACSQPEPSASAERTPDLLLVVIDTLRADATRPYNPTAQAKTPQLHLLAQSGVLFEDATAESPWTWPTHASMFTGKLPWEHGAHRVPDAKTGFQVGSDPFFASGIAAGVPTLAELLAKAGYQTVSLSANPLVSHKTTLARGFSQAETFSSDVGVVKAALAVLDQAPRDAPLFLFVNLYGAHSPYTLETRIPWAPRVTPDSAASWLQPALSQKDGQWQINPAAPLPTGGLMVFEYTKGNYEIPEEGLKLLRSAYEAEVEVADQHLARVVNRWVERRGQEGVLAVTSDHGELFGEGRRLLHGSTLDAGLLRVPLVVAAPGRLPAGQRSPAPVQPHDLFGSFLRFAGVPTDAHTLQDAVAGIPRPQPVMAGVYETPFFARKLGGVFQQGYRLYREQDELVIFGTKSGVAYHRLSGGLGWGEDRYAEHTERAELLVTAAREALSAEVTAEPVAFGEDELSKLKELGYVAE